MPPIPPLQRASSKGGLHLPGHGPPLLKLLSPTRKMAPPTWGGMQPQYTHHPQGPAHVHPRMHALEVRLLAHHTFAEEGDTSLPLATAMPSGGPPTAATAAATAAPAGQHPPPALLLLLLAYARSAAATPLRCSLLLLLLLGCPATGCGRRFTFMLSPFVVWMVAPAYQRGAGRMSQGTHKSRKTQVAHVPLVCVCPCSPGLLFVVFGMLVRVIRLVALLILIYQRKELQCWMVPIRSFNYINTSSMTVVHVWGKCREVTDGTRQDEVDGTR